MAKEKADLLTAGKIAMQLGVSGAVVSKTIKALGIKADLVKAGCSYYGTDTIKKVNRQLSNSILNSRTKTYFVRANEKHA